MAAGIGFSLRSPGNPSDSTSFNHGTYHRSLGDRISLSSTFLLVHFTQLLRFVETTPVGLEITPTQFIELKDLLSIAGVVPSVELYGLLSNLSQSS